MKKIPFIFFSLIAIQCLFINDSEAYLCKKSDQIIIEMGNDWNEKEEVRLNNENKLLEKYSEYISKHQKPLIREKYNCTKGKNCDPLKNCQMHQDVINFHEVEYLIKVDTGIILSKSHCSTIGKCIGYNDFTHSLKVTASENRLIDIRKDNAIFYHYFYSAHSENYESPFVMVNFHTGSELYLNGMPHFSPDERNMIEIFSTPNKNEGAAKDKFVINLYEMNKYGEYKKIETPKKEEPEEKEKNKDEENLPAETILDKTEINDLAAENTEADEESFLTQNPTCGATPHFHSWKNNYEIRLSMLHPRQANDGKKVVLAYNRKAKKWECQDDAFPEFECKSFLPSSLKYVSNLTEDQINECREPVMNILDVEEILPSTTANSK
jgi:hypothetical protein